MGFLFMKYEKHGMKGSPEYSVWQAMKRRCLNKNTHNYHYYGGRGVGICNEWKNSFLAFYKDMGDRPEGMTLDRIDVNGDYEARNCKWANQKTQVRNQRIRKDNKSGVKGVRWCNQKNKWQVSFYINDKQKHLGSFDKKEDAVKTRFEYEKKYWNE